MTDRAPLYQEIAEALRQEMLYGHLRPGERLPAVREMAVRWHCTPGTVQRAYRELARQGLVTARPGQGTVATATLAAADALPLRRAALVHRAEAFLLEALAAGHNPAEVEQAVALALDRWRTMTGEPQVPPAHTLRFVGSHDPAVSLIAARFSGLTPDATLQVTFAGSLGGLIALARGEADLAGSHLWDEESDAYNRPFVQRLLPGQRVALLTLAHRRLGLFVAPGNPAGLVGLADLTRPGLRFVNRQRGSGTRVWLDAQLRRHEIAPARVVGYGDEVSTHFEAACAVAEGRADASLGIEAAALAYGLGFVPLTTERYDLVIPAAIWDTSPLQALAEWLGSPAARATIAELGGYDVGKTGSVEWVE